LNVVSGTDRTTNDNFYGVCEKLWFIIFTELEATAHCRLRLAMEDIHSMAPKFFRNRLCLGSITVNTKILFKEPANPSPTKGMLKFSKHPHPL